VDVPPGAWFDHEFVSSQAKPRAPRIKPHKIAVLPNVIDLQEFDAWSALPSGIALPSKRVLVAAVGSLQACKRFDRFLEALALARRREPAVMGRHCGADRGVKTALQETSEFVGLDAE